MTPDLLSEYDRVLYRRYILSQDPDLFYSNEDNVEISPQLIRRIMMKKLQLYNEYLMGIYADTSTDRVKMEVQRLLGDSSHLASSLTYGDIDANSFANMLVRCSPRRGEVFVDLGNYSLVIAW